MTLTFTGRISAGSDSMDRDLRDIRILGGAGGSFLYAATGQNGGISTYRLSDSGGLAGLSATTPFTVSGMGVGTFDAIVLDGSPRLILDGVGTGKLVRYNIAGSGDLSNVGQLDLPGTGGETPGRMAATALADGRSALYMADAATGALHAWVSNGHGGIAADAALDGKPAAFRLSGTVALTVAHAGGSDFLLAADTGTQGVRSYLIDPASGALSVADSLGAGDGIGIAAPSAMQAVTAFGATWIVLAAAGSGSLSVMRLAADGSLAPADHLLDTRATRFAGVSALKVIEANGHVFVLAGGSDDGLSLFSLLPGGRLVHMQTLVQAAGLGLDNVTGIEAALIGDALQIFVTSGSAGGLSQFSLPLAGLGAVIEGGSGAGGAGAPLAGTANADLIVGRVGAVSGPDTLLGFDGDDILVSGAAGGVLTGGAGADIFVLSPTTATLRITDFDPGTDRLDLSAFAMLRSIDQLTLTPTSDGVTIAHGSTLITIRSGTGQPLSAADLWPDGFSTPDRVPFPTGPVETVTRGTAGNDLLRGHASNDTFRMLSGDDRVHAGGGDDRVFAGKGRDVAFGGRGADRLHGGGGDDVLKGGKGRDHIDGGAGRDVLRGGNRHDRLDGGAGHDVLKGGRGRDHIDGGAGHDLLSGGAGADTFVFDAVSGNDRITDFTPGEDIIRLDIAGLSFAGLAIQASGADVLIDTGSGTFTLDGLAPGQLSVDDFQFL